MNLMKSDTGTLKQRRMQYAEAIVLTAVFNEPKDMRLHHSVTKESARICYSFVETQSPRQDTKTLPS